MRLSRPEIRMTRQRQVILQELEKMKSHPTADEIYERVRQRLPRISLGTVYRNLETLSRAGRILKLELGGSQKRFDIDASNAHYHVRCTVCGRLDDIVGEPVPDIESIFQDRTDYRITGHQLVLTGLCPRCTKTKSHDVQGKEK